MPRKSITKTKKIQLHSLTYNKPKFVMRSYGTLTAL